MTTPKGFTRRPCSCRVVIARFLSTSLICGSVLAPRDAWSEQAGSELPLPVASYTLHASLDTELHRIRANGSITFTNRTSVPVTELWFHLYPNAFASEHTLFWRGRSAAHRSQRQLHRSGGLEVTELSMRGVPSVNLWPSNPTTPGDPDDATDCRVALQQPLQPSETIVLDVQFVTQLPFMVERMGWVESFHAATQWFPKLARLEPSGSWRHFPYHALAEFYADFGDYDITIDAPQSFMIAAAGEANVLRDERGRRVTRFRMRGVHDFAWFAWDRFEYTERLLGATRIKLYSPPGHTHNVKLELAEIGFALPRLQQWYGRYPYDQLVVVHPPDVANPAGGMEYPGLIVTGGPWYSGFSGSRSLSAVTLHELAHQWFYGIIATDEARYPVLDEGLASWTELQTLTKEYGAASAFSALGITVSAAAVAQLMGSARYEPGPLARAATSFGGFSQLTRSVYARMTLLLQTFGNVYGQEKLIAALHAYALQNRFEHPGPEALVAAIRSGVGSEAAKNLGIAFDTDGWVDFEPSKLMSRVVAPGHWNTLVRVHRSGSLRFPVVTETAFGDGARVSHVCEFNDADCEFTLESNAPATSVTVDPHRALAIESRYSNNTLWQTAPPKPLRLFEQLLYALQLVLGGLS